MHATETPELSYDSLSTYLAEAGRWVGQALEQALPQGQPRTYLYDLARDYPLRGGKRFRPALLLLCNALVGGTPRRALPAAVALELFQNFALVHDDIEDDSHLRRGQPALHRLHGVPLAINAGDLLFGLVYEVLLGARTEWGETLTLQVMARFAEVFRHTFEGQAMDIGWIGDRHMPTRTEFETMIGHKTGWYSGRGPCTIGALLGNATPAVQTALGDFGERLGIGFQVRDDLLNLEPDSSGEAPEALAGGYGKEQGGDIAEGKRTLIVIELMERLSAADASRLRTILDTPPHQTAPEDIAWAIDAAHTTGALAAVQAHCRDLGLAAREALDTVPDAPQRALLLELTEYLVELRRS